MLKHIFFLVVLSLGLPSLGVSQVSMGIITTEQRFIRNAVDSSLFIIRQDYTLKNINDPEALEYGLGGKDYFGRAYYLAVSSGEELLVTASVVAPWDQDPNFEQFRENDSIKPFLSSTAIRPVIEDEFRPIDDNFFFKTRSGIVAVDTNLRQGSLIVENNSSDPTGWGVFVYSSEPFANNEVAELNFKIYKIKPNFSVAGSIGEISQPSINGSLIGAVYLTENFGVGVVTLKMAGLVREENQGWGVIPIPESPEPIDLVPVEIPGDEKRVQVQFLNYRDSSPLPLLTIVDQERQLNYDTDRNGVINIVCSPEDLSEGLLLHLNDRLAICIEQAGNYSVECKYESSLFLPKRPGANCN